MASICGRPGSLMSPLAGHEHFQSPEESTDLFFSPSIFLLESPYGSFPVSLGGASGPLPPSLSTPLHVFLFSQTLLCLPRTWLCPSSLLYSSLGSSWKFPGRSRGFEGLQSRAPTRHTSLFVTFVMCTASPRCRASQVFIFPPAGGGEDNTA